MNNKSNNNDKHKALRETIREEVKKALKESILLTEALKLNKMYQVYDPGMDEWHNDYEYLGFDTNTREHMFRTPEGPGSNSFHFVSIPLSDINKHVKK